jgi:hypothetical protein
VTARWPECVWEVVFMVFLLPRPPGSEPFGAVFED